MFYFSVQTLYPLQQNPGQNNLQPWNQPKTIEIDQHETSVSCGGSDSTKSHSPELKPVKSTKKKQKNTNNVDLPKIESVPQPMHDWMKIKRAPPKTCKYKNQDK